MISKKIVSDFDKKRLPGLKITKHPSVDRDKFSSYGELYLQKFFINNGKGFNKMVAFGDKSKSFSDPVVFIIYDLKMQPAIFFEFKKDKNVDEEKFYEFVVKFFTKSKFKIPKKKITEQLLKQAIKLRESAETVQMITSGIMGVLTLLIMASYYFKSMKYAAEEYYVKTTVERELNNQLFAGQKKEESGFEMFNNLENYITLVINKRITSLILCGPPGMSKTYMVRRTLHFSNKVPGKDYVIEKGSALGLASVYQLLYDNRSKLIILDDFDTPLSNEDVVNLMKAATDSYGKRIISLSPQKKISSDSSSRGAAPQKFEFTGQIIMVTNKKKNDIDMALKSRSPVLELNFDTKEVLNALNKLLTFIAPQVPMEYKLEVFNYIRNLYKQNPKINVSFRSIKAAIDSRMGNPDDWKQMTKIIVEF